MNRPIDLIRYESVIRTESLDELASVIFSFRNARSLIKGVSSFHDAKIMADSCRKIEQMERPSRDAFNTLTRNYGIRQQAYYLFYRNR